MNWISVKDRLPKERQFVLAYQPHKSNRCRQLILCRINNSWYELNENNKIDINGFYNSITHWMPLPEPPKQ